MTTMTLPSPQEALERYATLVEENDEALPILVFANADIAVPIAIFGEIPEGGMPDALAAILPRVKEQFGAPEWLLFSSEGWMKVFTAATWPQNMRPGMLAAQRQAGDLKVMECMVVVGVAANGSAWQATKPFERVGGEVIWGEAKVDPHAYGDVPDVLLHAVR